ncbi:DUF6155 family protein [Gloeomargaritales cyanobacterium VI4D9]|nr:DUF6155 family protein [Gloeomargaritales cyanobacterium VI4D9]
MAQPRPKLTALKQYLNQLSKEELISDILELFQKFNMVKDYYQIKIYPEEIDQVREKYKKIIEHEFFPDRGFGKARLSVARKAVTDYQKIAEAPIGVADIMLFYVEQGVKFTDTYGDINAAFYDSMEGMYEKAVTWIVKYRMQEIFKARCEKIVRDTAYMGWGFHDALSDIYCSAFIHR